MHDFFVPLFFCNLMFLQQMAAFAEEYKHQKKLRKKKAKSVSDKDRAACAKEAVKKVADLLFVSGRFCMRIEI